jgi:hypothetical protein
MASIELRVLDTRIGARFDKPRSSDIIVGSTTPLDDIIDKIVSGVGSNQLSKLSICCHGYESGIENEVTAMSKPGGGFGLQLGGDDLTWKTVSAFSALGGKFTSNGILEIYACAAAEDTTEGTGFTGNGRLLMRELAGNVNATVRASDAVQYYSAGVTGIGPFTWYNGVDFGDWEGNVWLFLPDGSRRQDTNPGRGVH